MDFSIIESSYYEIKLKNNLYNTHTFDHYNVTSLHMPDKEMKQLKDTTTPFCNPNYYDLQEALGSLTPYIVSGYLTGGSGAMVSSGDVGGNNLLFIFLIDSKKGKEVVEEKKKEVPKEVLIKL